MRIYEILKNPNQLSSMINKKLLACVMIRLTAPGFVKTFWRIFDRDIPEKEYPFSYFNQAEDHAHSRIPPMSFMVANKCGTVDFSCPKQNSQITDIAELNIYRLHRPTVAATAACQYSDK
ncbi:hypothetical protein Tsp_00368 [Trichinella spiralis]|uniref:hypothetical protein n=1 Tax=Trichinella spiralis TaxID=6334 RepID=UPI0001EFD033|nr:hypothetical protein Tsp_00368 [Trichinella spiralis]